MEPPKSCICKQHANEGLQPTVKVTVDHRGPKEPRLESATSAVTDGLSTAGLRRMNRLDVR
jgi:hypothetical protein